MTAQEIVKLRTGATDEEATAYVAFAEDKVREYLRYGSEESLDRFTPTVAEVACGLILGDKARASTAGALKSQSFSEGGVSKSETYLTGGEAQASYGQQITDVLAKIGRYRRARVPEASDGADTE